MRQDTYCVAAISLNMLEKVTILVSSVVVVGMSLIILRWKDF